MGTVSKATLVVQLHQKAITGSTGSGEKHTHAERGQRIIWPERGPMQWQQALDKTDYHTIFSDAGTIGAYYDGDQTTWLISSPSAGQDIAARTPKGVNLVLAELDMPSDGWK